MDIVNNRIARCRVIKPLVVVDNTTHMSVAIVVEHSMGGNPLTRVLDEVRARRSRPAAIRTDNGMEFVGWAMFSGAYRSGIDLKLIERGTPHQNAYVESFNGHLRCECPEDRWFMGLAKAKAVVEGGRRDDNEHRPKNSLGGRSSAPYE